MGLELETKKGDTDLQHSKMESNEEEKAWEGVVDIRKAGTTRSSEGCTKTFFCKAT